MDCWYYRYECVELRPFCIEFISSDTVAKICRSVLAASLTRDRPTLDPESWPTKTHSETSALGSVRHRT